MPTHVVQVGKGQDVLQVLQSDVDQLNVGSAVITAIGAVNDSSDVMGNARRLHRNSGS